MKSITWGTNYTVVTSKFTNFPKKTILTFSKLKLCQRKTSFYMTKRVHKIITLVPKELIQNKTSVKTSYHFVIHMNLGYKPDPAELVISYVKKHFTILDVQKQTMTKAVPAMFRTVIPTLLKTEWYVLRNQELAK